MTPYRILAGLVIVGALAGIGARSSETPAVIDPTFTVLGKPTMPFVPSGSFISSTWYCPGVPAGEDRSGGSVAIANTGDEPLTGQITVFTTEAGIDPVTEDVAVAPRTTQRIELTEVQPVGTFLSAVVEIDGGGGFVEQEARHPAGNAVAACSNSTSSEWYFPDGTTMADSVDRIILTNPFPDPAIVDIGFVTTTSDRNPDSLKGYTISGRSVRVVELKAKDEPVLAAHVVARRGRVVAGRAQEYLGEGRLGFTMRLGAPSLSNQAYFADGGTTEPSADFDELYTVYNGTDTDVSVSVRFLGLPETTDPADAAFANDTELNVEARGYATLDTKDVDGLPAGRHGAVFSTFGEDSIVVDRAITLPAAGRVATSVVLGSPPELASTRWSMAIGTEIAIADAIVVVNADAIDTTVSVSALGAGGLVVVPGLEAVSLPRGGVVSIPIENPLAIGKTLVVQSPQRIYVERRLPRRDDLRGRSGSFALAG